MEIMNWIAIIISAVSLVFSISFSIYSFRKAQEFRELQSEIAKLDFPIKQNEVERIAKEKAAANISCVEARVEKISTNNYKLKVWNSGNVTVYNVVARFEDEANIIIINHEKMPFDELTPGNSFEIPIIIHWGSAHKFKIITEWKDLNGNMSSSSQTRDF